MPSDSDSLDDDDNLTPFQRKRKEWLQKDSQSINTEIQRILNEKTWPSGQLIADPSELTTEIARLRKVIEQIQEQLEKLK